jgi:hypothetical protein
MNKKHIAIYIYLGIGVMFALYQNFFGATAGRGFMYNLGRSLIWPAVMFPSVGQLIGGVVLVVVVAAILIFKK